MTRLNARSPLALVALLFMMMGCSEAAEEPPASAEAEMPAVETKADSVAMHVYEAYGGPEAWSAVRYLRFDFATGGDAERNVHGKHLWDRTTGDYRVEMPTSADTMYVALFNVNSREGEVYLDGAAVEGDRKAELLESAYRRYINDSYWLLMPVKLFDPGVNRTYLPDSSTASHDVLHLSFGDVGLTPGDQYWVYVNKETGMVDQWAFRLQRHSADHVPEPIEWAGNETFDTPEGQVVVSERKPRGGFVLFTDNVAIPTEAPDGAFSDPQPIL